MKKILFSGELPPNIYHGISLSNRINLDILGNNFNIIIDEEITYSKNGKKYFFPKLIYNIKRLFSSIVICKKNEYEFLYITFPTSKLGGLKTLLYIYIFKFYNKGRVVTHIHRGDLISFVETSIINHLIFKRILNISSNVVVLSDLLKKYIFTNYDNYNSISVLNNTIEKMSCINSKPLNFFDKPTIKFIFITNYIKEKGILLLLNAFKEVDEQVELHCYGKFMESNITKTILSYQSDKIKINGPIYNKEKFELLNQSHALILPSFNEGKPLILIEAMSVGTIIITSKVGYIEEMFPKNYPFFLNNLTKEELISKIKQVVNLNAFEKLNHSNILEDWYQNNHSINVHSIKLLEIFE